MPPGSSGCIDIGGQFLTLVSLIQNYRGTVAVSVRYSAAVPTVSAVDRQIGDIIYPDTGH